MAHFNGKHSMGNNGTNGNHWNCQHSWPMRFTSKTTGLTISCCLFLEWTFSCRWLFSSNIQRSSLSIQRIWITSPNKSSGRMRLFEFNGELFHLRAHSRRNGSELQRVGFTQRQNFRPQMMEIVESIQNYPWIQRQMEARYRCMYDLCGSNVIKR